MATNFKCADSDFQESHAKKQCLVQRSRWVNQSPPRRDLRLCQIIVYHWWIEQLKSLLCGWYAHLQLGFKKEMRPLLSAQLMWWLLMTTGFFAIGMHYCYRSWKGLQFENKEYKRLQTNLCQAANYLPPVDITKCRSTRQKVLFQYKSWYATSIHGW